MSSRTRRTVKKKAPAKAPEQNPLFAPAKRSFRIGAAIRHKTDVSRYVRWPRYVRVQRQRKILKQRLKVPPAVNQFTKALDKNQATELFRLLNTIRPETKAEKKERLVAQAAAGETTAKKPAPTVKFGLNHVTTLVEEKKARLVVIANDVDPIELVVWLPALCRHLDVPYCIVKNKARLGALVHQKTATVLAITDVPGAEKAKLESLASAFKSQFNDSTDVLRKWGGGVMGLRSQASLAKKMAVINAERAKKAMVA
jgi:large subunit ribosomal protein L7Ae